MLFRSVGNDAIGSDYDRFFYLSNVNMNSADRGAQFGIPGSYYYRDGVLVTRNANEDITWEIAYKTNIGFELGLFDDAFVMEADYFREHRTNILMDRTSIPTCPVGKCQKTAPSRCRPLSFLHFGSM